MSTSPINELIGCRLTSQELVENCSQFTFDRGPATLSIYNRWTVRGPTTDSSSTANALVGRSIVSVQTEEAFIGIAFEGGWSIMVDLRDEAYDGPEAMQLRIPGRPIVVWN